MSDIHSTSIGYISPVGDFSLRNTQALGGVSQLWQDFFAQAMAEQLGDAAGTAVDQPVAAIDDGSEPVGGSDLLAQIHLQRLCDVRDTEVKPPEPLFLPKAEFELDLLDKAAEPFPADEMLAQQQHLEFDNEWVRPVVMSAGRPLPEPGPTAQPRALHLPIAEFEWDLADKPAIPYDAPTLAAQQGALEYDHHWARPIVLHNLRLAA